MAVSLRTLTISQKLTVLSLLFLVPILLLGWLLIAQSNKDIAFAQNERAGSLYLSASIWPMLDDMVLASVQPAAGLAAGFDAGRQALPENQKAYDADMRTAESSTALGAAAAALKGPLTTDQLVAAIALARTAGGKVADGSNLTLDPDLDSYYVQDLITVKLADFVDLSGALVRLAQDYQSKTTLTTAEKAAFLIAAGQFSATYSGVQNDIAAAIDPAANPDRSLAPVLSPVLAALVGTADSFVAEANALGTAFSEGEPQAVNLTALLKLHTEMHEKARAVHKTASQQLVRLLDVRTEGFQKKLNLSLAITFVVVLAAWFFSRKMARSIMATIGALVEGIDRIAEGGLNVEIPFLESHDELSEIARALERFRNKTVEKTRLHAQKQQADMRAREMAMLKSMAGDLEGAVGKVVERLTGAIGLMRHSTQTVLGSAQQTGEQVSSVNVQTSAAATNIETVASAAVELSASINEISGNITTATTVAREALQRAENTRSNVDHLAEMAQGIGGVLTLINDIANQTNLLALNATIEAARAGDAGKGFAVVAGEVKNLAAQTSHATEEIAGQIEEIQTATREAVIAITEIAQTVQQVTEISTAISAAIEEQSAATGEISRSIQSASDSTHVVVDGVGSLESVAGDALAAAQEMETATQDLSEQSGILQSSLATFLTRIRTEQDTEMALEIA